jgi:polar amino acid transport system substrate-binding protein
MISPARILVLMFLASWPASVFAQPEEASVVKLVVATRHVPPFAIKGEDGNWSGIAIDLLREVAEALNEESRQPVELEFREMTLKEMLSAVEQGNVDLVAAALTVNFERESKMDFTHPFHTSGLGIAVVSDRRSGWLNVLDRIFSVTFLKIVTGLFGLLLLSGVLIYLVERHHNKVQFGGGFWRGLGAGVWWSIVTLTTVEYGDKSPKTIVGRGIAVLWMLSGILIIASFTAAVTSSLTVGQLRSRISGPSDLTRVKVATVADSTSHSYLQSRHIRHQRFPELADALAALDSGQVEAVVYDAPILRFQVVHDYPNLHVLSGVFERQDYAIALSSGSPLRERVNRAVLRVISTRSWDTTLADYLGER